MSTHNACPSNWRLHYIRNALISLKKITVTINTDNLEQWKVRLGKGKIVIWIIKALSFSLSPKPFHATQIRMHCLTNFLSNWSCYLFLSLFLSLECRRDCVWFGFCSRFNVFASWNVKFFAWKPDDKIAHVNTLMIVTRRVCVRAFVLYFKINVMPEKFDQVIARDISMNA